MPAFKKLLVTTPLLCLLASCGQVGELYLPVEDPRKNDPEKNTEAVNESKQPKKEERQ